MGLNPSNGIAQRMNPTSHVFPNLARYTDGQHMVDLLDVFKEVDDQVRAELMEAGILNSDGKGDSGNYMEADWIRRISGTDQRCKEVPCQIFAAKHRWVFERRWYYYNAEGPGIPPDIAEEFHKTWGTQVRVEGHCGCPSPLEYCEGFAVSHYHIDTQEGLNAFVKLLASIHKPKPKEA